MRGRQGRGKATSPWHLTSLTTIDAASPNRVEEALAFDDVLVVPAYSQVLPAATSTRTRLTRGIWLNIPLISAAMDTVTESDMAIAMAQLGGLGVIHKNLTPEQQSAQVRQVKKYEVGHGREPADRASGSDPRRADGTENRA